MTLKDGTAELRLSRLPNHHADGMLIAHIMPANIVWVTDLYSPGLRYPKHQRLLAFNDALKRLNIKERPSQAGTVAPRRSRQFDAIISVKPAN